MLVIYVAGGFLVLSIMMTLSGQLSKK